MTRSHSTLWAAALVSVAALWAGTGTAAACVDVRVESTPPVLYDPLAPTQQIVQIALAFSRAPNCSTAAEEGIGVVDVAVIDRTSNPRKMGDLDFLITQGGVDVLSTSDGPINYARQDLTGRSSARVTFDLVLPRGQFGAGGIKQLEITYTYIDRQCSDAGCVDVPVKHTEILLIDLRTLTIMSIGIAGSGQDMTVDLGELASNMESRRVTILARSTAPFVISFDSENDLNLKKDGASGSDDSLVPYRAFLGGDEILTGDAFVETARFGTRGSLLNLPFWIKLGDIAGKRAGKYRDRITLTIEPLGL